MYNQYNPYNRYIGVPQPQMQPPQQPIDFMQNRQVLNGKQVESIEVVKAMDIPMDGSTSYFPIADGSAIVSKQLQMDGTSKTTIFKPITEEKEEIKYITQDDLKKSLDGLEIPDIDDLKEDIREIRKEIKDLKKKKDE